MVTNEQLKFSLEGHADLYRKLVNFCDDYSLREKPAFIWQCRSIEQLEIDMSSQTVRHALQEGAGEIGRDGWWYAFRAGRQTVPVFDGLAALSASDEQGWMTEMHADGHIIAGVWNLPDIPNQTLPGKCVADFHVDAFADFCRLTKALYGAAEVTGPFELTCTLLNSAQVHFHRNGYPSILRKVGRPHLQWRVRKIDGLDTLDSACQVMAGEFLRAYGVFPSGQSKRS